MTLKAWYKYSVNTSYSEETYKNLTPSQVETIEKRFSDNMFNGDYVDLCIEISEE